MSVGNTKKFVVKNGAVTPNIEFIIDDFPSPAAGQMQWNLDDGTLDLGLNGTDVILQIGQETLYRVQNNTGSTIPNGTLCMFAGTLGQSSRLLVAPWDGNQPSQFIMGIATEDILDDSDGFVTHFGKVRGIDTTGAPYSESWSNGDILYAGPSGGLTNVKPDAPNVKTIVAVVINAHPSVGALFVRPTFSSNLDDDDLVELDNLQDGDILRYVASENRFENTLLDDINKVSKTSNTGSAVIPAGDETERDGDPQPGFFRFNTDTESFEGYDGNDWGDIGGGGIGGAVISNTAPSDPDEGDLWWDSTDGNLYVYYDDGDSQQWVITNLGLIGPPGPAGPPGAGSDLSTDIVCNSLGVGTEAPETTGDIIATGDIVAHFSDDRLKTRLNNIENSIDILQSLSAFYYEPNEIAISMGYDLKTHIGLSAQEVQRVLPEVIKPAPINDKYLTIQYEKLVPLLVAAIQEQQKRIDDLESRLDS